MAVVLGWASVLVLLAATLRGTCLIQKQARKAPTLHINCEQFKSLNCDFKPELKSGDGYAQIWLAQDSKTREKVILKVLCDPGDEGEGVPPTFMTRQTWLVDEYTQIAAAQARRECDFARKLAEGQEGYRSKGQKRFMRCYSHNMPEGAPGARGPDQRPSGDSDSVDEPPLHLVLEFAGDENLFEFKQRKSSHGKWGLSDLDVITKEILEGLDYLQRFPSTSSPNGRAPIIHHDLKPSNLMVTERSEGAHAGERIKVTFIDFGGMVQYDGDEVAACEETDATPSYASPEFRGQQCTKSLCGDTCNFDPGNPEKFDMFALGAMFINLLTGKRFFIVAMQLHKKLYPDDAPESVYRGPFLNHDLIWRVFKHKRLAETLIGAFREATHGASQTAVAKQFAASQHGLSFLSEIVKCFAVQPEERPTADDLLQHPYMLGVETA